MGILSIMIDEAGNFDMDKKSNPFYCLTLVFHNQNDEIHQKIEMFDAQMESRGFFTDKAIHTSPLIRKEPPYGEMDINQRKNLFRMASCFVTQLPIKYKSFIFDKTESDSVRAFQYKMTRAIDSFINYNLSYFQCFDKIILYYDKGQKEISELLHDTFEQEFSPNVELRVAYQNDYKLLQVADYLCTLEFIKKKWDCDRETKAERVFFGTRRSFVQDYYNKIRRIQLEKSKN